MSSFTEPSSDIKAEAQRQLTGLLYRNAGIAQSVQVVNATFLAYVNASLHTSTGVALGWWCLVLAIAVARYLLSRRFRMAEPDAVAAMTWRRRYIGGTAIMAATWGAGTVLFMWDAPDGARLFTALVLCGMVAGSVPLLAPVPAAFQIFAALVSIPMSAVILLQANSTLHWAFGVMILIFLAAVVASARTLHATLDAAIRLGLEQGRLVENLERARGAAEVDLQRRKAMEQELQYLATTDPLTGIANRRRFLEQAEIELARVKRFGVPAAFLMVDIDHFKDVNDTYGHAIGDVVLQHFSELSRSRLRRIDLFGRLGGEEFGILLPGADAVGASQFADHFRRYVADTPFQSNKGPISITVSIGVAAFDPSDTAPDSILARADAALYRAKEAGRNRVEMTRAPSSP